ncbi:hypothetical protein KSD_73630 [Ktedonobacter sp. SOSP1-85]|uniref:hypothetical protein n=1 Tax=Ktedonobacter sp. SOSP1-85 TaxID=2778367 RepID=UPI001916848E|nr:hypothetical protein [Ktedonobacter sp. SOSP1-85]GHO79592.1 hypothetical protein KSD_73630 [Ktedonobacter sp. SOSP1-85]
MSLTQFTTREEDVASGQREWRGRVQLITNQTVRYFRQWDALVPLLLTMVSEDDVLQEPNA